MKILNLYAGIGGNRKLWGAEHEITAVEFCPEIAKIYSDFFPDDKMIVGDAHEYLLKHYKEFDFIWSSPPCPSHSKVKTMGVFGGAYDAEYVDMTLYQEIILLTHFAPNKTKWVIENVKPYYKPLIPAREVERHLFWTNFYFTHIKLEDNRRHVDILSSSEVYGYSLKKYKSKNKKTILRNLINPKLGLYLLNEAMGIKDETLIDQKSLF